MWMPRKYRRKLEELQADADRRLAEAQRELQVTQERSGAAERIARTSDKLAAHNSIAAVIRHTLAEGKPKHT